MSGSSIYVVDSRRCVKDIHVKGNFCCADEGRHEEGLGSDVVKVRFLKTLVVICRKCFLLWRDSFQQQMCYDWQTFSSGKAFYLF